MSINVHETLTWSIASDAGSRGLSGSQVETGTVEQVLNTSFAAGTGQAVALAFAHATLKSIFLLATANCTLQFNSTTSPTPSISLVAGVPFVWDVSTGYWPNPFTADVTALYVTCTGSVQLQARILN